MIDLGKWLTSHRLTRQKILFQPPYLFSKVYNVFLTAVFSQFWFDASAYYCLYNMPKKGPENRWDSSTFLYGCPHPTRVFLVVRPWNKIFFSFSLSFKSNSVWYVWIRDLLDILPGVIILILGLSVMGYVIPYAFRWFPHATWIQNQFLSPF